jgi:hypothetical protein
MNVCNFRDRSDAGGTRAACIAEATAEIIIDSVDGVFITAACPNHQAPRIEAISDAGIWEEVTEDCSIIPHVVVDVRSGLPPQPVDTPT